MEEFTKELLSQLDNKISFVIPIGKGIPVPNSVVITWIIMVLIVGISIVLTRNLKVIPVTRTQLVAETIVDGLNRFFEDILGKEGRRFIPYLITVVLYIGFANLIGLLDFTPPTKDLNVTAALALSSIVMIEYAGISEKGIKGWLKSFAQPMGILLPINLLEIIIRPLSLCMRLFGNVLGSFVIMKLIEMIIPCVVPVPFSLYFDIFDGLIQAYVFVFLTSLFIKEAIE